MQARIQTGFHRFTEIDRIFHIKYVKQIDLDEIIRQFERLHPRKMELANTLSEDSETQERGL